MFLRTTAFIFAALCVCSCVGGGPRPVLREPTDSLDAMRAAYERDDAGLFIHTLSGPVLARYSEYVIKIGWGEIRPRVGELVKRARVGEVSEYQTETPELGAGGDYIWPEEGQKARRVQLVIGDKSEDFLFVRETDPAPENAKQAKGFWVGDHYFVRREHDSPQTYMTEDAPEKDRTHWRLVFPYYPFQREGELGRMLRDELSRERKEPEKQPETKEK